MGWRYLLEDRLKEFNEERMGRGRQPLRWADVGFVVGISRQALQNLSSNREMKVTNTRHLDALCRFFNCGPERIMEAAPSEARALSDEEIDRLVAVKEGLKAEGIQEKDLALDVGDRPPCHIDVLYSEEALAAWKTNHNPPT